MACIEQKNKYNFLIWNKVVGSYTLSELQANGIPVVCDNITPVVPIPGGWNILTSVFNQSVNLGTQDANVIDAYLTSDGLKMYMLGGSNNTVYEYDLSIAFDISTSILNQSFSVLTQDNVVGGLFFNTSGSKMFIAGRQNDKVYEYDLSIEFDISTSVFSRDFSVSAQDLFPFDLYFKPDGTKMYLTGSSNDSVYEYNLSTGFDLSTAVFNQSFSVNAQTITPAGIFFKTDGTKMYIDDLTNDKVHEYNLSTGFDISTAIYNGNFYDYTSLSINGRGLYFKSDGTKMYLSGSSAVYEYDLTD